MAKITFKGFKVSLEGFKESQKRAGDIVKETELPKFELELDEYSIEGNLEEVTKMTLEFGKEIVKMIPVKEIMDLKREQLHIRRVEAENRRKSLEQNN